MNNGFTSNKSKTDWARLHTMDDKDIDLSDCPEVTPEMFSKAAEQQMALALKIYADKAYLKNR